MARRRFTVRSQVEKARRRRRALIIISGILFIVLVVFSIWALRHERFLINEVIVQNETSINDAVFESLVERETEGSYLFLIPKRNAFILPKEKIVDKTEAISPEIASVEVSVDDFRKVTVEIKDRVPYSIWCGLDSVNNNCFFADRKALIFEKSPNFSYDPFPVFAVHFKNDPLGKKFLEAATYQNILSFYDFLDGLELNPSRVIVKNDSLSAELSTGSLIIFDPENLEKTAQNVKALLSPNELGREGFDFGQAEYVDLRYGNKVFWKPKN